MTTPNTSPSVELDDTTRAELERAGVIVSKVDFLYNWARGGSVWPLTFGLACCAMHDCALIAGVLNAAKCKAQGALT